MPAQACVLVVDDDRLDRAMACLGLNEMGFAVVEVGGGPDALATALRVAIERNFI